MVIFNTQWLQISQKIVCEKLYVHEKILRTRNCRRRFIKNLLPEKRNENMKTKQPRFNRDWIINNHQCIAFSNTISVWNYQKLNLVIFDVNVNSCQTYYLVLYNFISQEVKKGTFSWTTTYCSKFIITYNFYEQNTQEIWFNFTIGS